jgi:hypothetical protein
MENFKTDTRGNSRDTSGTSTGASLALGESDVDGPGRTCAPCQPSPNWAGQKCRPHRLATAKWDGCGRPDDEALMSGFGRTSHENFIKPCRALSCRYPVNCIIMRPERHRSVANPASQRHDRSAEAGGKATEAAGKTAKARSVGKYSCIWPGITDHSNAIGTVNRSKAASERFSIGEACRA